MRKRETKSNGTFKTVHANLKRFVRIFLVMALLLFPAGCAEEKRVDDGKIKIFVSILPQAEFVEKIGGEYVDARVMVGPGQSPATYEPTPKQMAQLSSSHLYFAIGVPFEKIWLRKIMDAHAGLKIVPSQKGIELRFIERHSHEENGHHHREDSHETMDPHVWLSPRNVIQICNNITEELIKLRPELKSYFTANFELFETELLKLDGDIRAALKDSEIKSFMVFHPSWGYFADEYGLEQISVEKEGKTPSAKYLASMMELARRKKIKVLFVQQQFSTTYAAAVARAVGAKVITLDPLSRDYINNMLKTAKIFAQTAVRK